MTEVVRTSAGPTKADSQSWMEWLREQGFIKTLEFKNDKGQVVDTAEAVSYQGLLALAHENGLKRVFTEVVQLPTKENEKTAVFLAEVETKKGIYRDYGDANPQNVNRKIVPHIIRMASTRSKARAFRDALNIGVVCAEELEVEVSENGKLMTRATPEKLKEIEERKSSGPKTDNPPAAAAAPVKPKNPQGQRGGNGNKAEHKRTEKTEVVSPGTQTNHLPVPSSSPNGDYHMTDRQRNYLFRLASDLGHQGGDAHEYLKDIFQVESLKEVTKVQANEGINLLLEKLKEQPEEVLS